MLNWIECITWYVHNLLFNISDILKSLQTQLLYIDWVDSYCKVTDGKAYVAKDAIPVTNLPPKSFISSTSILSLIFPTNPQKLALTKTQANLAHIIIDKGRSSAREMQVKRAPKNNAEIIPSRMPQWWDCQKSWSSLLSFFIIAECSVCSGKLLYFLSLLGLILTTKHDKLLEKSKSKMTRDCNFSQVLKMAV